MADFDFSKNTNDERILVIGFNNERPIRATQLAAVLSALDRDYRSMNGAGLVLGRMELGSNWIWLIDAGVYAGIGGIAGVVGYTTLSVFAAGLREGFTEKKLPDPNRLLKPTSVNRSIKAIGNLSQDSDASVTIRKPEESNAGGTAIEVVISRDQAVRAKDRLNERRATVYKTASPRLHETYQATALADEMRKLPVASADLEAVIRILVQAHLMTGSTYILEQIANTLEAEGRHDVAIIIRSMLGKGGTPVTILL